MAGEGLWLAAYTHHWFPPQQPKMQQRIQTHPILSSQARIGFLSISKKRCNISWGSLPAVSASAMSATSLGQPLSYALYVQRCTLAHYAVANSLLMPD